MLDSKTYYITKNDSGRNILVINQFVDVDGSDEIKGEDFDIIFVDIADFSFNEISLFLQKSSPFYSRKCFMKPRFIKTPTKDILDHLKYLIDGYGNTPYCLLNSFVDLKLFLKKKKKKKSLLL